MNFSFTANQLEVRLARNSTEIEQAQKLRFDVFYREKGARTTNRELAQSGLDQDEYDIICDHLLVLDHKLPQDRRVVGNYRLLLSSNLPDNQPFYTQSEFNLDHIIKRAKEENLHLMELGRSCVDANYRTNSTIQLLWRGITAYMLEKKADVLFGCASFDGTDAQIHKTGLSYLHHYHCVPPSWYVCALPEYYQNMNLVPKEQIPHSKKAMALLPPLVKSYLRLGAYIGEGAVIDPLFSTIDVCIMLPVEQISERYYKFFARM